MDRKMLLTELRSALVESGALDRRRDESVPRGEQRAGSWIRSVPKFIAELEKVCCAAWLCFKTVMAGPTERAECPADPGHGCGTA